MGAAIAAYATRSWAMRFRRLGKGETVARERSLRIEVPEPAEDEPRLARVGIVAAAGFLIGIIWPWAAGVQLGRSAPTEQGPSRIAAPPPPSSASAAPEPGIPEAPAASKLSSETPSTDRVKLGKPTITSCRDRRGTRQDKCDALALDPVIADRLRGLATCEAAKDARGMLSIGFELNFDKGKIERLLRGRSTTFSDDTADALLECATKELAAASLRGIEHAHAGYTLFYPVEFLPRASSTSQDGTEPSSAEDEVTPASGMATVVWNAAIVRDAPSREGARMTQVLSGTRVAVVGRRNDWYKIKYDAKGNEGWVFKGAIGL